MGGPFKIVLASVERRVGPDVLGNPTAERVLRELARMFNLDRDTAGSIISATPIVLVDGLDGHAAQVVRDRLRPLGDLGAKITVTDDVTDDMPRIDWPQTPPIAHVDPPHDSGHASRNGGSTALHCPGCGLSLQLVRADGHGPPLSRDAAGARGAPGGGAERDAPPPAPPTREPARSAPTASPAPAVSSPARDDDADWLAPPPTSAAGRKPPTAASTGRAGTRRFDDPALLPSRAEPGAAPTPKPADPGKQSSGTLKVAFAPPSDEGPLASALDELDLDDPLAASGASPASTASADPFELIEDSRADQNLEERRSQRKRGPSRPELDPFASDRVALAESGRVPAAREPAKETARESSSRAGLFGESSSRGGPPAEQPFPAASPFEDSGNIESIQEDSASDLLGPPPPKRRGGAAQPAALSSDAGPGFESDLDLLGDDPLSSASDERPAPRAAASSRQDASDDPFDDLLVDDESSGQRGKARDKGRQPAKAKAKAKAGGGHPELPDLNDSKDPELDQVLRMFGPEDEEPLDDGRGLDPLPPDLGPPGEKSSRPTTKARRSAVQPDFGGDMSDILEPLDPDEALKIMKGTRPAPVRSGRSSTASHIRLEQSGAEGGTDASGAGFPGSASGLEPLDPSEAFAILAADTKDKGRGAAKKSRGVPYPATDEDVSLFEDSSAPRRPSPGKKPAPKTDPFARARKQLDDEPAERSEPAPAHKERKSERAERPERAERAERKSERSEKPDRKANERSGPRKRPVGPPPPGKEGDGEHGLVLSRINDPDKKEQAAELIVSIKGCALDEARKLTDRTIIPVLKGVSRELAEHHLERFKELDIAGRVTTRQRG